MKRVIRCFPEYWEQDALLKNKLIDDIRSYKTTVIKALLANELIKDTYSLELDGITIFKVEDFVSMLRYKNYWEDSYTKYSNEIGLTNDGKYLNYTTDVVLDFPHKDGVLEGGMTKEDVGKREIYYHNVLAKKEIDTLLAPKVLSNMKKYNANGEQNIIKFNDTDNLIIKGNNLIALHTLKERYAGKVKLIYIDPPYNTGGDSFKYNDRFNRSTWLTFMKNRLKVAFSLLKEDGVIVIQTDNNENHYLKVLCDEIFGNNKFVTQVCVEMSATQGMKVAAAKNGGIVKNTEYLLFYSKDGRKNIIENLLYDPRSDYDMHYSKFLTYDYKVKNVKDVFMEQYPNIEFLGLSEMYKVSNEFKEFVDDYQHNIFRYDKVTGFNINNFIEGEVVRVERNGREYYLERKSNSIEQLMFLGASYGYSNDFFSTYGFRKIRGDWWSGYYLDMGNVNKEGNVKLSSGKKPERLIYDLIISLTKKEEIVLDFFMGSGTSIAAALKTQRQFIGLEQLDYIEDLAIERFKNVISGEQTGVSQRCNWEGGGSFVYAELHELNQKFVNRIQAIDSNDELFNLIERIKTEAFLDFQVHIERIANDDEDFLALSLEEKKDVLIQALDANQMYLNYSEIDDASYSIPDDVKAFNRSFYGEDEES
uniref:site-specific DNA-methyltransferase n=1 Tax=Tetragenococcus halophilus TaxID=51669 RepID=UPI00159617B4|nr:site-specific DNA-methyltransferase [Tetragenococcus halophilus]